MMDYPLLIRSMLERGRLVAADQEIVSRDFRGVMRYTVREMYERVCQLAHALDRLGIESNEHIGSFAWNNHRHLELYFAVPCSQRVLHTINIRLFAEQLVYIINHAEDRIIFIDEDLLPLMESIADKLPLVERFIIMTDAQEMPATTLKNATLYEELIRGEMTEYAFPDFDEWTTALLGYTSATTGMPKGVEYSHRGLFLHCMMALVGELGVRESDVSMPIVPMFHVNAWGRPFADTWIGAKQVYPGSRPTAKDFCELIDHERVTYSAGVPTVWMGILQHLKSNPGAYDVSSVRCLLSGGSALPQSLVEAYEKELGIPMYQGYGQTETSPITFISYPKKKHQNLQGAERYRIRAKTGHIVPGLEMRLVDPDGNPVPYDGKSMGELLLRGPWVLRSYYKDPEKSREAFLNGWFRTGDIATMDSEGYLQVVDRTRDLIKSGGEWISSVDLENVVMGHPEVLEAAVIAVPHERWQERPIVCVVLRPEAVDRVSKEDILQYFEGRVAKWWIPDEVIFVSEIPKTSVGKFSKKTLREQYQSGSL